LTGRRHGGYSARAALATGALCLLATGCSSTSSALGPKGTAIYETTISARTAKVWVYLSVQAPHATTYVLAEGETNLSNGASALGVQAGGVTTHELYTRNDLYFEVPAAARATNGGKTWAEVVFAPARAGGRPAAAPPGPTGPELTDVDPAPLLDVLASHPERSVFLGMGRVGGQPPEREYRLDFRAAAPVAPLGGRTPVDGGVIGLLAGLPHPAKAVLAVYVWLDKRGRAVQVAASATLETEPADPSALQAALANRLPATISVRVDLSNFGEPFKLDPPPAGEVSRVPVSQLQAGVL
jgi:hypothetical protein